MRWCDAGAITPDASGRIRDGSSSAGFIDCYRRGAFVLEAKKLKAGKACVLTRGFDDALLRARAQAEGYARALPAAEGRPPFLLVVDVGHVIELYAEFTRSGAIYTPFPDARSHRIALADLLGLSPRRYLMLRRMAAVRRDLLAGGPGATVTDTAMRWGFFHLGRFAEEYAALFSELPSQTLRTGSQRPLTAAPAIGWSRWSPPPSPGRG